MWRRRKKQSALSRQLALARLDEALRRAEESQRRDESGPADGPEGERQDNLNVPEQRSTGRAAHLVHTFFQLPPGGRDRDR